MPTCTSRRPTAHFLVLPVGHDPLRQVQRIVDEDQGYRAGVGLIGLIEADLQSAGAASDAGDGDAIGQLDRDSGRETTHDDCSSGICFSSSSRPCHSS